MKRIERAEFNVKIRAGLGAKSAGAKAHYGRIA